MSGAEGVVGGRVAAAGACVAALQDGGGAWGSPAYAAEVEREVELGYGEGGKGKVGNAGDTGRWATPSRGRGREAFPPAAATAAAAAAEAAPAPDAEDAHDALMAAARAQGALLSNMSQRVFATKEAAWHKEATKLHSALDFARAQASIVTTRVEEAEGATRGAARAVEAMRAEAAAGIKVRAAVEDALLQARAAAQAGPLSQQRSEAARERAREREIETLPRVEGGTRLLPCPPWTSQFPRFQLTASHMNPLQQNSSPYSEFSQTLTVSCKGKEREALRAGNRSGAG